MSGVESLALAALITAGVGTGLSAYGMYRQGESAKAAAGFNEDVAAANAEAARSKAAYEEEVQREKLKRMMGRTRALYAKAGVNLDEGSPLLSLMQQTEEAERDAQAIRYNGDVAATQALNQGRLAAFQGNQAYQAGMIGAGSTFLTGMGKAMMSYGMASGGGGRGNFTPSTPYYGADYGSRPEYP